MLGPIAVAAAAFAVVGAVEVVVARDSAEPVLPGEGFGADF